MWTPEGVACSQPLLGRGASVLQLPHPMWGNLDGLWPRCSLGGKLLVDTQFSDSHPHPPAGTATQPNCVCPMNMFSCKHSRKERRQHWLCGALLQVSTCTESWKATERKAWWQAPCTKMALAPVWSGWGERGRGRWPGWETGEISRGTHGLGWYFQGRLYSPSRQWYAHARTHARTPLHIHTVKSDLIGEDASSSPWCWAHTGTQTLLEHGGIVPVSQKWCGPTFHYLERDDSFQSHLG